MTPWPANTFGLAIDYMRDAQSFALNARARGSGACPRHTRRRRKPCLNKPSAQMAYSLP